MNVVWTRKSENNGHEVRLFHLEHSFVEVAPLASMKPHHVRSCEKWLMKQWAFVLILYNVFNWKSLIVVN